MGLTVWIDDEVAGDGNSMRAEFWQYDPRIGRRWNLDPKPNPSFSWYSTFADNPLLYSDHKGDTIKRKLEKGSISEHAYNLWISTDEGKKFQEISKKIKTKWFYKE